MSIKTKSLLTGLLKMSSPTPSASSAAIAEDALSQLRFRIDGIDEKLHRLLMERADIIANLIDAKQRQGGGSAFRPAREAEMMRRLLDRHSGILPLDAVESIWRIIIATFTYAQKSYSVHADCGARAEEMRDSARFHFGFTAPLIARSAAADVIEAVNGSNGDLGLICIEADAESGWWRRLIDADAPKIIARLPFVARPNHPAALPVFVISKPLAAAPPDETQIFCFSCDLADSEAAADILSLHGGARLNQTRAEEDLSILASCPSHSLSDCQKRLRSLTSVQALRVIGGHAAIFTNKT